MNSDGRLFQDDVPVDFFRKCSECENDIKKLMKYWKRIGAKDSLCLQVHIRSVGWIPMLEVFIERWGLYCASADLHRCYVMVKKEQPTFLAQCEERVHDVGEIRNHREWIEGQKYPFPRVLFYQNHWIPKVEAFIQKWTSEYVPDDVKRSLAEVKERYPIDR